MNFPSAHRLLALALLLPVTPFFQGCVSSGVWTPISIVPTKRQLEDAPAAPGTVARYVTTRDWRHEAWVIKKGAVVSFRPDGFGTLSARVFTQEAKGQELHLQAIQYGRDGNLLFAAPAIDSGLAVHAQTPNRDYPVDVNFGYDQRQFPFIERVQIAVRVRHQVQRTTASQETVTTARREVSEKN